MKKINCTTSLEKMAFFAGIAGMSCLISFPVLAEIVSCNPETSRSSISQNSPREDANPTSPNSIDNPGGFPNEPNDINNPTDASDIPSQRNDDAPSISSDRDFMMQAARDGLFEVELGRMAMQRASSNSVRNFGQRMVDEHTQANDQLMQLARQKGISLPTDMSDEHRETIERLSNLSGTDFDRAYTSEMVNAHNKAVYMFQVESQHGQDPQLRSWASSILPNLRQHLSMARQMVAERI